MDWSVGQTVWCDHAGGLLFADALRTVGDAVTPPQPWLRQALGSVLAGARNVEQTKHLNAADLAALLSPQGKKWLASYADNGPQDLDPATNHFRFKICSLPISSSGASITVNETCGDDVSGGSSRFATAGPLPDVSNVLSLSQSGGSVTLSWQMNGGLQARPSLTSGSWTNVPGCSPVVLPASSGSLYFRVAQ